MSSNNDGGPAYPTDNAHQNGPNTYHHEGMSLRDYFAGQRATTLPVCRPSSVWQWIKRALNMEYTSRALKPFVEAQFCYDHADAMVTYSQCRVFKDGNMWCAVMPDFEDLQASPAGFGKTPDDARADLHTNRMHDEQVKAEKNYPHQKK